MESYSVTVLGRCQGTLTRNRILVPWNGPMLTIMNEADHPKKYQCTGFHKAALDSTGHIIGAGDFQGNIYVFNMQQKRFWFVCNLDKCCSYLAFTTWKGKDLIVASSDCSVVFLDSETGTVKSMSYVHQTCVNNISQNISHTKVITSSLDLAIIWNLQDLSILHKLNLKKNSDIIRVFFLSGKEILVSAFKDCSVFLWDSNTLSIRDRFICKHEDTGWLKTIDGSKDGSLIALGGRTNEIKVWSLPTRTFLYTISLPKNHTSVKQLTFLSTTIFKKDCHLVSLLSNEGKMYFYDIIEARYLCKLSENCGRIVSYSENADKLAIITSTSHIEIYNLGVILIKKNKPKARIEKINPTELFPKIVMKSRKIMEKGKKDSEELGNEKLGYMLTTFHHYPTKYRTLIWGKVLQLPINKEYILYWKEPTIDYPIDLPDVSPAVKKSFLRIYTMICEWCSPMAYIDFIPIMILPFVKHLHRNIPMCFELILTFIMNWCQNWFQFIPFIPYNIIAVIENLLLYHDRILLHHLLKHSISPEVYAFSLLKTSFSEVFVDDEWLQLWDNIFSYPPDFLVFTVVAYNIITREALFSCIEENDVKVFLSSQTTLAENVVNLALVLRSKTPECFNPSEIVGIFSPLPCGSYPVFIRFAPMIPNLQTLDRQHIIDDDIEALQRRQQEIKLPAHGTSEERRERIQKQLAELEQIQELLRFYVMQSVPQQDVQKLAEAENKVSKIQNILQKNLAAQVQNFEYELRSQGVILKRTYAKDLQFKS